MSKSISNEKFLDEQVANFADAIQMRKSFEIHHHKDEISGLVESMQAMHQLTHSINSTRKQKRHILKSAKHAWMINDPRQTHRTISPASRHPLRLIPWVRGVTYAISAVLLLLAGFLGLDRMGKLDGLDMPGMAAGGNLFYVFLIVGGGLLIALILYRDKK